MIINKLYLKNLGKFENKEIEFKKGINLFVGKNETGKSTIATALKTFFYAELNGKGKYKKNYIPLSSDKGFFDVSFTLDNESGYKSLVTLGKTNGKTLIKTINEATGEELEGGTFSKPGELFFSLSEEMFDSVCYIKDLSAISNVTDNKTAVHDKLSKTENNIVDVDLSEAIKKTKDHLTLLQRKTATGKIFPYEKRLEEVNALLLKLNEIKASLNSTEEKITLFKEEENKLKNELKEISKKEEYLLKYKEYENTKNQLKLKEEIEKLKKETEDFKDSFKEIPVEEIEKIRNLSYSAKIKEKNSLLPLITAAVVVILSFALSFVNLYFSVFTLLSAPLFIVSFKNKKENKAVAEQKKEYKELLLKYNIESTEDYLSEKEEHQRKESIKNLSLQKIEFLTSRLKDYNSEFENVYLEEPDFSQTDIEFAKDKTLKRLTEITIEINTLSEKKKAAFTNMPDFYLLSEEKKELLEKLEKLKEEEKITADCLNILNITNDSFKASYIPYLNREVKKILNDILDEKIDYFNINDDLICEIRKENSENIIPKENLSNGTDALVYFAVRLAMYNLVSKKEKIPLILDDCFAELDDERFEKTFKYLAENIDSQIIYFTSHERILNLTLANTTAFRL